jgi:hypothetical protein
MNHLKTSQERRDRWYAKHISPLYVPTKPAQLWSDLWDETTVYSSGVSTLPFQWLVPDGECSSGTSLLAAKMRKAMECHGFLIVSGVLEQDECDQALAAAWDWIEAASDAELHQDKRRCLLEIQSSLPPVHRQDLSTLASTYFPRSVEGGMMPFYGSGHSRFAWMIRSNPKVKQVGLVNIRSPGYHSWLSRVLIFAIQIAHFHSSALLCFAGV